MDVASYHGWDRVLVRFMKSAGLLQALNGFENDMLVMNPDFEKTEIPLALQELRSNLMRLPQDDRQLERSVEEDRISDYIHLANGALPVSQTQLTRSISTFLAQNRARNNASNRNEFLRKRRRADPGSDAAMEEGSSSNTDELPTCARTDAAPVNREMQMKYDIAKNEGGPLRRTVKSEKMEVDITHKSDDRKGKGKSSLDHPGVKPTLERHPGLGERFSNIENHLAVRYVPSPPESLLDRIRFIEDHIMRLERDYPPWAALHFNQPNRGWPPPPRTTPLIVASHLTSTSDQPKPEYPKTQDISMETPLATSTTAWPADPSQPGNARGGASKSRTKTKSSSLHRAVMDKLEVKKALAGED